MWEQSRSEKPIAVTIGLGKRHPQGELVELDSSDPVSALGLLLSQHVGVEAWWSGGVFTDNYREGDRWLSQQVIGIDIDYSDTLSQHAPLTSEARSVLSERLPAAPCAWAHLTPRGARLVVFLDKPIIDQLMYPLAWSSLATHVEMWLPKVNVGSLRIDKKCNDLARYFWTPRSTVGGVVRGQ